MSRTVVLIKDLEDQPESPYVLVLSGLTRSYLAITEWYVDAETQTLEARFNGEVVYAGSLADGFCVLRRETVTFASGEEIDKKMNQMLKFVGTPTDALSNPEAPAAGQYL